MSRSGSGRVDRERLEAVVADRNSSQNMCGRARIALATADGCGTARDHAGLLHDKTRKAGKAPVPEPLVAQ
jgi:hypothetical protein